MEVVTFSRMTREDLITNFRKTTLAGTGEYHKKIKEAYNIDQLFKKLPTRDRASIYLKCLKFNAELISTVYMASVGTGTAFGAIAGSIVGAVTTNPLGVAGCGALGSSIGAAAGVGIGTGICISNRYWYQAGVVEFELKSMSYFNEFCEEITKEHYALFLQFLKNYIQYFSEESIDGLNDYICQITFELPSQPVFSPHDLERRHVYERSMIEKHLENMESLIEKAKKDGKDDEYIKNLMQACDPFRGPYFKKEELVYDLAHSKKTIKFLRSIQKKMCEESNDAPDPRMSKGLASLILHYQQTYQASTRSAVGKMMDDMLAMGMKSSDVLELGTELEKRLNKVPLENGKYKYTIDLKI